MPAFRSRKKRLEALFAPQTWPEDAAVPPEAQDLAGMEWVGPLLALLPRGGLCKWRAVMLLGTLVSGLAAASPEEARDVVRRCMWLMNEDSGNMGWGAAEAMGEILANSPPLATEFGNVLLSYARDTGFADNYIECAALRRGTFWGIGRFAPARFEFWAEAVELLGKGLSGEDGECKGLAAWGMGNLVRAGAPVEEKTLAPALRALERENASCEFLDNRRVYTMSAAALAARTLRLLSGSAVS